MSEHSSTDTRRSLVAFVTLRQGEGVSREELRAYVAQKLPRHLIPNRIEFIEAIPTLPNGKVDRRSLKERAMTFPANEKGNGENDIASASTATEERLIAIWITVLSIDHVGASDDFFELGGHSLLATRLVAKTNREFGSRLSIVDLFDHPVLADFARLIDEQA